MTATFPRRKGALLLTALDHHDVGGDHSEDSKATSCA